MMISFSSSIILMEAAAQPARQEAGHPGQAGKALEDAAHSALLAIQPDRGLEIVKMRQRANNASNSSEPQRRFFVG